MGNPTRFPNGITNNSTGPLRNLPIMAPTKVHEFFDDFLSFTAGDWQITTVEAGAGSATEAAGDARFGQLVLTNDNADDDSDFLFFPQETFLLDTGGKQAWFESRMKVSDATQCDFVMGLGLNDTTPLATTDAIYFRKNDGDASLDIVLVKNTVETEESAVATLSDDTFVVIGWYYNGVDAVEVFVDGVKVATMTDLTNFPDDTEIAPIFGIQNGEAASKVMTIDYIYAAVER